MSEEGCRLNVDDLFQTLQEKEAIIRALTNQVFDLQQQIKQLEIFVEQQRLSMENIAKCKRCGEQTSLKYWNACDLS